MTLLINQSLCALPSDLMQMQGKFKSVTREMVSLARHFPSA